MLCLDISLTVYRLADFGALTFQFPPLPPSFSHTLTELSIFIGIGNENRFSRFKRVNWWSRNFFTWCKPSRPIKSAVILVDLHSKTENFISKALIDAIQHHYRKSSAGHAADTLTEIDGQVYTSWQHVTSFPNKDSSRHASGLSSLKRRNIQDAFSPGLLVVHANTT